MTTADPLEPNAQSETLSERADGLHYLRLVLRHARLLIVAPLLIGTAAVGVTFIITPRFTAKVTLLAPQQPQSAAMAALASLGSLSSLAGNVAGGVRTPADQYVALLGSIAVQDPIVDKFNLMTVYEADFQTDARTQLTANSRISAGKKDGLITIEVKDKDPKRAAAIANAYIEELRDLTARLAVTEAQQRRAFFETQLSRTRDKLTAAQIALQSTGFNEGALRAEPKAAAEAYARLRAEATSAEVRLRALRESRSENTPEVQTQRAALAAMQAQLAKAERQSTQGNTEDYVTKYRDFKYQEALFDLFARQYESARLDESREGALIQVIDPATPPERRSFPKRGLTGIVTTLLAFSFLLLWLIGTDLWHRGLKQSLTESAGDHR